MDTNGTHIIVGTLLVVGAPQTRVEAQRLSQHITAVSLSVNIVAIKSNALNFHVSPP